MRDNILILGLCGRAGSGKSSVAQMLQERHGAKRLSFAAPLKKMAIDIFRFSDDQVYGDAASKETIDPRWGIPPRVAMQRLGQAARDHLGETVWIKAALEAVTKPGFYVIEDLRYRNEAEALYQVGHPVFRLHCLDRVSNADDSHPSEREVDLIPTDHVAKEIHATREQGLERLFEKVEIALGRWRR